MRLYEATSDGTRASALWGKRGSGKRGSALWGKGGRFAVAVLALTAALFTPASASAARQGSSACGRDIRAVVPADLVARACANKSAKFSVIIQGRRGRSTADVRARVRAEGATPKRSFRTIAAVSVRLSGGRLLALARRSDVLSITPDARVVSTYEDAEMWRQSTHIDSLWSLFDPLTGLEAPAPQAPAIAVVDSGVDATRIESFGTRLVADVNLSSLAPGATGDDQGHGTMVAGIAAGADPLVPGVAQNAPIVSIRTSNAQGQSMTSDVIAAADWIHQNHERYNIRVVNFSLGGSTQVSFRFDPLNRAVERLWFDGIVVVAAAGNHGEPGVDDVMSYAPANDPFVITVGALDQNQTAEPLDDFAAPWSGQGYTMDGFYKPDVSAPGRYMIMPVPASATIPATVPERVVAPGYMWMSGTSFSAPVVSGVAAQLLARNPDWTPDDVKGALMVTAVYIGNLDGGVGEIDAAAAAAIADPPNPNENLYDFVDSSGSGGERVFNEASWARHVEEQMAAGASWAQANWASASWARASWARSTWSSASWARASYSSSVDSMMTSSATLNQSAKFE